MTLDFEIWSTPEEDEDKVIAKSEELTAGNYDMMMGQTEGLELPGDMNWYLSVVFFGMGKPIRLRYSHRVDNEEVSISEQNHSGRVKHTMNAEMGGPFLIHELLEWSQQLHSVGDWLSW
jgi:hypothetical protein